MESTGTTATNSDANEFCIGRAVGKIRPRKVGATPAQAQGLATKKAVFASKSAARFLLLDSSLERGPCGLVPLSQVYHQFNLTQRDQEVLLHLLQGRNKEIANRMNINPNTVRAFLRLIMIKTGVSSRSAIVGKIIMTQQTLGPKSTVVSLRPHLLKISRSQYNKVRIFHRR
jgi:DNA-binding CsgD family transcriptional regulator